MAKTKLLLGVLAHFRSDGSLSLSYEALDSLVACVEQKLCDVFLYVSGTGGKPLTSLDFRSSMWNLHKVEELTPSGTGRNYICNYAIGMGYDYLQMLDGDDSIIVENMKLLVSCINKDRNKSDLIAVGVEFHPNHRGFELSNDKFERYGIDCINELQFCTNYGFCYNTRVFKKANYDPKWQGLDDNKYLQQLVKLYNLDELVVSALACNLIKSRVEDTIDSVDSSVKIEEKEEYKEWFKINKYLRVNGLFYYILNGSVTVGKTLGDRELTCSVEEALRIENRMVLKNTILYVPSTSQDYFVKRHADSVPNIKGVKFYEDYSGNPIIRLCIQTLTFNRSTELVDVLNSIITAQRNSGHTVKVLWHIHDDGSSDPRVKEYMRSLKSRKDIPNLEIVTTYHDNQGIIRSRKFCMDRFYNLYKDKTDYVMWLDSDDRLHPFALNALYDAHQETDGCGDKDAGAIVFPDAYEFNTEYVAQAVTFNGGDKVDKRDNLYFFSKANDCQGESIDKGIIFKSSVICENFFIEPLEGEDWYCDYLPLLTTKGFESCYYFNRPLIIGNRKTHGSHSESFEDVEFLGTYCKSREMEHTLILQKYGKKMIEYGMFREFQYRVRSILWNRLKNKKAKYTIASGYELLVPMMTDYFSVRYAKLIVANCFKDVSKIKQSKDITILPCGRN